MPLPVSRPAANAPQVENESQPKARPSGNLDKALKPAEPAARKTYQALIKREAEKNGLPPDIADAVAAVESGYDPGAIGSVGEVGRMQEAFSH